MIINNHIVNNHTFPDWWSSGGGIECSKSSAFFCGNVIAGNDTDGPGGGFCIIGDSTPIILNNTIAYNQAGNQGGGIFCADAASPKLMNTILWGNTAPDGSEICLGLISSGDPVSLTISSSDVEGGLGAVVVQSGNTLNWGYGMIDADPLFTTGEMGDYYLSHIDAGQTSDSPCIDAGYHPALNLAMTTSWTRTDGLPDTGKVDIGAHFGSFTFPSLTVGDFKLPETGGTINLILDAGDDNADRTYILMGSMTGIDPGFLLPGGNAKMPLNWDGFTQEVLEHALLGSPIFTDFCGTLNGDGLKLAKLGAPPIPGFAGTTMHFAFCLGWPWEFASNPVEVTVVP